MRTKSGIARRKASDRDVCRDDRDRHIMSKILKLRPLGFDKSLQEVRMMLEGDRGKPHCKVIEDMMLDSYCKGYCKGFLKDCRKIVDAQIFLLAKKVLKIGFLPLSEIAPILKLRKTQVKELQASMA